MVDTKGAENATRAEDPDKTNDLEHPGNSK